MVSISTFSLGDGYFCWVNSIVKKCKTLLECSEYSQKGLNRNDYNLHKDRIPLPYLIPTEIPSHLLKMIHLTFIRSKGNSINSMEKSRVAFTFCVFKA